MPPWITLPLPILIAATAVPAAGVAVWWALGRGKSAEEIERERRIRLVHEGRIIDGTVLDWTETAEAPGPCTLIYRYDIAGVTYECAQDLTWLRDRIKVDTACLGMPASIRYDSHNPGNSIIIAETWSGLRRPSGNPAETEPPVVSLTAEPPVVNRTTEPPLAGRATG